MTASGLGNRAFVVEDKRGVEVLAVAVVVDIPMVAVVDKSVEVALAVVENMTPLMARSVQIAVKGVKTWRIVVKVVDTDPYFLQSF